jgi:hypothetical protein
MVESKSEDLPRSDKGIIGIELNQDDFIYAGGQLHGQIMLGLLRDFEGKSITLQIIGSEDSIFTVG